MFSELFDERKAAYEMRIGDRSSDVCSADLERLIEFGIKRGGQCDQGGDARNVRELRLQIVQSQLGLLTLRQVLNETGEQTRLAGSCLTDVEMDGKGGPVAPPCGGHSPNADYAPLAGAQVALHVTVVPLPVGRGHEIGRAPV